MIEGIIKKLPLRIVACIVLFEPIKWWKNLKRRNNG